MSDIVQEARTALAARLPDGFDGSAKFVIDGEGTLMIDPSGVRVGDEMADVTLTADAETFRAILDGALNPTSAFMTGKLSVDGDMGAAMRLAGALG